MAENELIIEISADTVRLIQSLDKGSEAIDEFANTGKISIDKLNDSLRAIRNAAFSSTDVAEIRRLGQAYREVQEQGRRLNDVFNDVQESTRRSRIAVYGLNQVVRDLPFGFIAISNNIPVLIDQLAELRRNTGSTGGAIRSFLAGLVGFGGISILLSAGISLVTTAVQKYGSLSAAFKELTGSVSATEAVQNSYNKALAEGAGKVAVQISNLTTLNNLSKDATIGVENQKYATQLLVQEVDKLIVSQDLQKQGITEVSGELLDYAKRIVIVRANIKGFSAVIDQLGVDFAKATLESVTFFDKVRAAVQKTSLFIEAARRGQFGLAKQIAETNYETFAIEIYNQRLAELTKRQQQAQKALDNYIKTETKSGVALIDALGDELKLDKEREKERVKAAREAAKAERERAKLAKNALQDLLNADKQALQDRLQLLKTQLDAQKALVDGLKRTDQGYLQEYSQLLSLQEELDRASAAIRINDKKTLAQAFRAIDQEYYNRYLAEERRVNDVIKQERQKALKIDEKDRTTSINNIIKGADAGIKRVIENQQKISQEYIDNLRAIVEPAVNIFNKTLAPAIDSVFNAILNGQDAIKALGNSFKQLIIDLTATVIKAAALAAIISVISGGKIPFSATFRAGLSSRGIGDFLGNLLPSGGFGLNAAPINGPGGFGLSGQVVFVQRGPDLVGVLNQGNARIGRVG